MLDLGRLRVLRELKLRGTLAAVADALGYTPSAVSQQLAQLQRDVGVPVVERAGRRLRLTEAGEVLVEHAEALLDRAKRAEEAALAASGRVAGTVRPRRPELTSEVLVPEIMRVGMPEGHPLAGPGGPVRMADLAGCPWATGHVGTNHADLLERTCVELGGFRPDVRFRSNDLMVIFAMVAQGGAVCLVPDLALAEREEGIVVRDVADAPVDRRMVMWTRVGAQVRPSVEAVLRELRRSADLLVERRPSCRRGAP
ncbi:DNA-binding transcriptional LysR family regulator [Actinomadura coerulea]|uniref:DNA-binding transcriptional LysR family regulator n=1 Tax=Actinomadura coerulea TaxID=46159 RepID=A0A7X0G1C7_9ACTN|nr:LysR family transcriptional regulator [Actinomadura coerulea]MBB6397625.1 DNA-binding transcriptional LysR family regulator [Actinomadura coerulea]GGQ03887.1 LysR family transcriptional regulator [Actinomadura coerulea]